MFLRILHEQNLKMFLYVKASIVQLDDGPSKCKSPIDGTDDLF